MENMIDVDLVGSAAVGAHAVHGSTRIRGNGERGVRCVSGVR